MMRIFPLLVLILAVVTFGQSLKISTLTKEKQQLLAEQAKLLSECNQQIEQLQHAHAEHDELVGALDSANQQLQQALDEPLKIVAVDDAGWAQFKATYYNEGWQSTGKAAGATTYGITKSGRRVEAGVTAAVDPRVIPLGSWVAVRFPDGSVETYRADDTGSAVRGNKIDIYIPFNDKVAMENGVVDVAVKIIKQGEGL